MVYSSFLISHVPPAHSFFQKKYILINLAQNLVQLIFYAYQEAVLNCFDLFFLDDNIIFIKCLTT